MKKAKLSKKRHILNGLLLIGRLIAAIIFLVAGSNILTSGEDILADQVSAAAGQVSDVGEPASPPSANTFAPLPTAPPVTDITVAVTGDLMVHRWQMDDAFDKTAGRYDFSKCFALIKPYLSGADFTMGNLETTLNGYEAGYSGYPRFNSPDAFAQALKDAGFDFLTTANNHCNDTGEAGILRTIQELDSIGLGHTGTFTSPEARDDISVVDVKGIRLAILAYTYSTNGLPVEDGYGWSVNILDRGVIKADIARAKALQPDLIIVCPHMGVEYAEAPSETYRDWAQYMLQCGADVVIASHPHVLQQAGYETVTDADGTQREGFIIYSMGNFVSSQRTVPRDEGIILNLHIEKTAGQRAVLKDVSFIPTWVEFVNAAGSYDIRVLSVYDALKGLGDNTPGLRQKDVARLQEVESEITNLYLGKSVPLSEIQNEYVMPKPAS